MNKVLLSLGFVMALIGSAFAQGSTSASIRGQVKDQSNSGIPGATVQAVHEPTGTQYGIVTDAEGYFRLSNVKVGGPYTITISSVGFENYIDRSVYLTLGQTYNVNTSLGESVTELSEVVVFADDLFDGNRTGASTNISTQTIESLPNVGRSVGDFCSFNSTGTYR